jgi:hypothetical protein
MGSPAAAGMGPAFGTLLGAVHLLSEAASVAPALTSWEAVPMVTISTASAIISDIAIGFSTAMALAISMTTLPAVGARVGLRLTAAASW